MNNTIAIIWITEFNRDLRYIIAMGNWRQKKQRHLFKVHPYWLDIVSTKLVYDRTTKEILIVYKAFYERRWSVR